MKIKKNIWSIYALLDPRTNMVRYVGLTKNIGLRFRAHLKDRKNLQAPKIQWIQELLTIGLSPLIKILETANNAKKTKSAERKWIKHFKDIDNNLTNLTAGGEGCFANVENMVSASVYFPNDLFKQLDQMAEAKHCSRNKLIEYFCWQGLGRIEMIPPIFRRTGKED